MKSHGADGQSRDEITWASHVAYIVQPESGWWHTEELPSNEIKARKGDEVKQKQHCLILKA